MTNSIEKIIEQTYENEIKIVRAVCHNVMGEMLKEEKLQEVVIFHLKNFKSNLEEKLKNAY